MCGDCSWINREKRRASGTESDRRKGGSQWKNEDGWGLKLSEVEGSERYLKLMEWGRCLSTPSKRSIPIHLPVPVIAPVVGN